MPLRSKEPADYRRGPLRSVWPSSARVARRRTAKRADEEYGATAEPDWREVDWHAHQGDVEIDGASVHYVDLGRGRGPAGRVRPRPRRLLAELAREPPGGVARAPRDRARPARLRALGDAARAGDQHHALRAHRRAPVPGTSTSGTWPWSATRWAASPPPSSRSATPTASSGWCWSTPPGSRSPRPSSAGMLLGNLIAKGGGGSPGADPAGPATPGLHPGGLRHRDAPPHADQAGPARRADLRHRQARLRAVDARAACPTTSATGSPEISCPTLVVQGDQDILVPLGDAREYERRIPKATSLILADTGHVPMIERPPTFNRALLEFLGQEVAPDQPSEREEPVLSEGAERPV